MWIPRSVRRWWYGVPSLKEHIEIITRNIFTPDLHILELKKSHPVFICDDFMSGHRRHDLLNGAKRRAWGFTKQPFAFWFHKKGEHTYPIPFMERSSLAPNSVIKGELYFLPTSTIKKLDEHRANGIKFFRIRVSIVCPWRTRWYERGILKYAAREQKQRVNAYMYVGNADFWDQQESWLTDFAVVSQNTFIGSDASYELLEGKKYYFFKYECYFKK